MNKWINERPVNNEGFSCQRYKVISTSQRYEDYETKHVNHGRQRERSGSYCWSRGIDIAPNTTEFH